MEHLSADRDLSTQPLFRVMLAVDDGESERLDLTGLTLTGGECPTGTAKFDLTFVLIPYADRVEVRLEYRTSLFGRTTATRIGEHLRNLLAAALADPDRRLADLPLMGDAEARIVSGWSMSRPALDDTTPVHHLVDAVAAAAPDAPAITHQGRTVTYRETTDRAHRLAGLLGDRGVTAETPVGVCLPSCPDLMVAFLGVLGAGGMYVPLDPTLPTERLRLLITDAGVRVVLTDSRGASRLPGTDVPVVVLDRSDHRDLGWRRCGLPSRPRAPRTPFTRPARRAVRRASSSRTAPCATSPRRSVACWVSVGVTGWCSSTLPGSTCRSPRW